MFQAAPPARAALPAFLCASQAVHELRAPAGTAAHVGLAALILAAAGGKRPQLWVSAAQDWYPPGLASAGIDPARCLFARVGDDEEALGLAELGLRGGMAGVVECRELSRLAARRLALAAKRGQAPGILLRHAPARTAQDSTAFASRWMVHPAPGSPHAPRLKAELLYAKGAMPGTYFFSLMEVQEGEVQEGEAQDGEASAVFPPQRRGG